jgi:hypothetical protein
MLALGHRLSDDDLVFCDPSGEPLWGRHVTTLQLKALLRRAGLPPIRFHDLRHTFATLQLAAGSNPKIVSEVLGHKIAITLDRYSHALPTMQAEAMGRLDAVLGRSPLNHPTTVQPRRRRPRRGSIRGRSARRSESRMAIRVQIRVQTPVGGQQQGPVRAWIGPLMIDLVPHTGFR